MEARPRGADLVNEVVACVREGQQSPRCGQMLGAHGGASPVEAGDLIVSEAGIRVNLVQCLDCVRAQ